MSKERLPVWQIPVTDTLDALLEEAVRRDTHVSKSDLVREAVREKLARMGFVYEKDRHAGEENHGHKHSMKR